MKTTTLRRVLGAAMLAVLLGAAAPAPEHYTAFLGPTPINDATKPKIRGRATASVVLQGDQISITGAFHGLAGPATSAELRNGLAVGAPGPSIAPLKVSPAASGEITGAVSLNADQLQALRHGRLYIQVNSETAPQGNLWGWILSPAKRLPGATQPAGSR